MRSARAEFAHFATPGRQVLAPEDDFASADVAPTKRVLGAILAERSIRWRSTMLDLLFVVLTVGFFAVAWAYVRGCERV
jgi:hypothetical protein